MGKLEYAMLVIKVTLGIPLVGFIIILFGVLSYWSFLDSTKALGPDGIRVDSTISRLVTKTYSDASGSRNDYSRIYVEYKLKDRKYFSYIGDELNTNYRIGDHIELYNSGQSRNVYQDGDSDKYYNTYKICMISSIPCIILTLLASIGVYKLRDEL